MAASSWSRIPFAKYSGAGNDFVVVDRRRIGERDPARLARLMCPRSSGVGVDGLALVASAGDACLRIRFFNPDGSEFGTCGNGTRCAALWAHDRGWTDGGRLHIETADGPIEAVVEDGAVSLDYRIEARIVRGIDVEFRGRSRTAWLVRIGTPHLVLPLSTLPEGPIEDDCRPLRHLEELGADGANVDLVALDAPDRGSIRTFERGVEGETLACGSGAMAAALALHAAGAAAPEFRLATRSGDPITVTILDPEEQGPERGIRLAGPARRVFEGRFPVA